MRAIKVSGTLTAATRRQMELSARVIALEEENARLRDAPGTALSCMTLTQAVELRRGDVTAKAWDGPIAAARAAFAGEDRP